MFSRILIFLGVAVLLGCSREDDWPGYDRKSGDLGAFLIQRASTFGAHTRQTNSLPQLAGEWRYKEDANGCEIFLVGDHFAELQSFLTAAFGPPARPPSTNNVGGNKSIGASYGADLGAVLNYGWESSGDGKNFTSIVVTKPAGGKGGSERRPGP